MRKISGLLLISLGIFLIWACTRDENGATGKPVVPGIYSSDLLLATEQGGGTQVSTRGLDSVNGYFTDVYPYDYIYIHSADNKSDEEGHKCLKIPLQDVVFCDGCQGIHLEMEVLDESAGGGYIIKNKSGESIKLDEGESVYFSTIDSAYWKANVVGATPVSESDVFIQDSDVNKELLRSAYNYSKEDLVALLSEDEPDIPMTRHCTAFRVYFMFTEFDTYDGYIPNENIWKNLIGEEYGPEHFYIKLYLGPNFTDVYDVYNDLVPNTENKGFYVTNGQQYQPFEVSSYNTESGTSGGVSYRGFGYLTDYGNYLIAPLNKELPAEDFSIYAFVKYTPDIENEPEDFLTSDEGAKWFQLQVPSMTLETNRVHYIILQVDLHNLEVFKTQTTALTRASRGPERIEVEYKAFNVER